MTVAFDDFVSRATGGRFRPYAYQRQLAEEGLPELLRVPTGSGKTMAATIPWLWRRREHPDPAVRSGTPLWLVLALPMRVLVEQTLAVVRGWLHSLGVDGEVAVHPVMGGEGRMESAWRTYPERDAVFVGTIDMLLSRALNRGYAASRFLWPIDFGLFTAGCQWVFDEVQLMGPALPTSLQLEGLRQAMGTASRAGRCGCPPQWRTAGSQQSTIPRWRRWWSSPTPTAKGRSSSGSSFLEAVVRLGDWRMSAAHDDEGSNP